MTLEDRPILAEFIENFCTYWRGTFYFSFQHHVQTVDAPDGGFCWGDFELSSSWILDSPRGYNMKKKSR